jgi:hypothetical protein
MTTLMVGVGGLIGVMSLYGLTRPHDSPRVVALDDRRDQHRRLVHPRSAHRRGLVLADLREGLGVGLLGGFTTFSTFSVQAVLDVDAGEPRRAAAYVVVSVVGGLAAATAGYVLGRRLA